MSRLAFYFVDVFAEQKYSGNQLAVVDGGAGLSTAQMQDIANEMHFSETTFIISHRQHRGGFDVRIFTPVTEVPFAGHPTLGTAYVIKHFIMKRRSVRDVLLNLKVGQIPVSFDKIGESQEIAWMKQMPPTFGKTFSVSQFIQILKLEAEDFDNRYPIQEVSTGLPFIIVPLKTLATVRRAKIHRESLLELAKEAKAGILVFCPETYNKSNDLNVRVFVDLFGIPEDPATGSGNGCLAGYLSRYRYFGTDHVNIRVEQGYKINRRSLLLLKAENKAGEIRVYVGGKVVLVASGKLM
ncbi:MAG: PhzF family phenazine biosynthesis protein [Candidatus Bathyarchaeota archaeon]|nr:PhzF family phenazine biosynthesis protein [Candidatus Bathyarchaeota archaeon]